MERFLAGNHLGVGQDMLEAPCMVSMKQGV